MKFKKGNIVIIKEPSQTEIWYHPICHLFPSRVIGTEGVVVEVDEEENEERGQYYNVFSLLTKETQWCREEEIEKAK